MHLHWRRRRQQQQQILTVLTACLPDLEGGWMDDRQDTKERTDMKIWLG